MLAWGALQGTRATPARFAIGAYAGLVILSTMLTGQHHVADVVTGAALSLTALVTLEATYPRANPRPLRGAA